MNAPSFFIQRPVMAIVLNAMLMVIGFLCLTTISLREYPEIKLPSFSVYTHYPNASAELVESTVTNILEDQLAGVEGLETITSQSRQGSSNINLTFIEGTSLERALIAIRDAIGLARSDLPKDVLEPVVQQQSKADGPPFMAISLFSKSLSFGDLTHYANLNLKNPFRSLKGVASTEVWGQPFTMTVTLDPQKLYAFGINADDVYTVLEENNISWPVGKFQGETPTTMDLSLSSVQDFENLLIKENNGKPIFLKSIADIQLKTNAKRMSTKVNGKPGLIISISRTSDSNPLNVSKLVNQQVESLKTFLPNDMVLDVVLDQADFIRASLRNIQRSIIEAIFLVLVIVFVFLRSFRATLIPLVTIPISLVGSIILLKIFGFSINTITLLAMVLAIGLVVDDAIVAMTLTLASVYAPIAFIQGAVGQLFIEFAVALAGSVFISGVVALTLSPLMCGKILRPKTNRLFPKIDHYLAMLEIFYEKALAQSLRWPKLVFTVAGGAFISMPLLFIHLPSEIAPKEDRGMIGVFLPPIPGKDVRAFEPYIQEIEAKVKDIPEAKGYLAFMGEWGANVVVSLKPHEERAISAETLVNHIRPQMEVLPSVDAYTWSWESGLPGLDDAVNGMELTLAISTIGSYRHLFDTVDALRKTLDKKKIFESVRHDLSLDTPGYSIALDSNSVSRLGLSSFQISKMIEV